MNFLMNIIGYPLGWIMWAAYKVVPIYSIALIIFTVIVRAAMIPLGVKQQKNQAHMMLFKPKVDAINKRYANNKQKAQEEINKLYEREGYNPFGGCSSLFIQLPIIYGLIDVVYRPLTHILRFSSETIEAIKTAVTSAGLEINARGSLAVEMQLLGNAEKYKSEIISAVGQGTYDKLLSIDTDLFGVINLGETPTWALNWLFLIPVFSLITALLSSIITMKMTPQNNEAQGKGCTYGMMFGMPFMSAYFSFLVPAGVGLYWIISNVLSGIQSVVLRKIITPEKYAQELEKKRKSGKVQKKSKFMTKLMEAQEQAQAQQGAYSKEEKELSEQEQKALAEAKKKKAQSDSEKLAEARKRYAEKYGDDIK